MKKYILLAVAVAAVFMSGTSCKSGDSRNGNDYVWPEEAEVVENLHRWQDLKFGMIIHWGLYSQLGVVESWSICSEEEDWITRDTTMTYEQYKRHYWSQIDKFNPVDFDPEGWAREGRRAGMKYVLFTTKHHDGFCMFDTRQTDFSIMNGAFRNNPRRNVTKEVFDAFRAEDYMIGAYFSKPDWHSQYYWWDKYATPNRNNNYDIARNPERWEKFRQFTHAQLEEIVCGDYGDIDILWLDGGWVRPVRDYDLERWGSRQYKGEQDVDIPQIAEMVRGYQPGMIIVDRSIAGPYENYRTPEREIPEEKIDDIPWESCITLGNDWGWTPTDIYKSPADVVHMLVEIVAKGGNLVLGIGPKPDGTLPAEVVGCLRGIGEWMDRNGEAIHDTRPVPGPLEEGVWFTQNSGAGKTYATILLKEGEAIPEKVGWHSYVPSEEGEIILLETGKAVDWENSGQGIAVAVPKGLPEDLPALSFAFVAR